MSARYETVQHNFNMDGEACITIPEARLPRLENEQQAIGFVLGILGAGDPHHYELEFDLQCADLRQGRILLSCEEGRRRAVRGSGSILGWVVYLPAIFGCSLDAPINYAYVCASEDVGEEREDSVGKTRIENYVRRNLIKQGLHGWWEVGEVGGLDVEVRVMPETVHLDNCDTDYHG